MKVKYKEITEGFEFNFRGRKVVIVSDYEKWDKFYVCSNFLC